MNGPSHPGHSSSAIVQPGIPANGVPCVPCYGTGRIMLAGAYYVHDANGRPTAGPFYSVRCRDTGGGLWPKPEHNESCGRCGGTGIVARASSKEGSDG